MTILGSFKSRNDEMEKAFDCVVIGSCVVDVLARPVTLTQPIGAGRLIESEPLILTTGGIVSNSGITLARLGMRVAAFTYVGDDEWADVIRHRYAVEGVDTSALLTYPNGATSTTAVLIDPSGERSFVHCVGAPRMLDSQAMLSRLDLFARSRSMLLGYYPLMTRLQPDLPEVLAAIREAGCLTSMDSAGQGGTMDPLARILPHLDFYVPNESEAANQTGRREPREMIMAFRDAGAAGWLGIKLGARGALISPEPGEFLDVAVVQAPGPVVDTTGAGDCFYGGLLAGVLRGLSPADSGRLAAAAGACCVTGLGATTAIRGYDETARLAGIA
ncbi:MAG TPA: carbohydrate kinase family protein [Lacipirellulaceae bacterium]|nr:carbohydrate kinase family protein [Lacipirellulaceae bacterium]